MKFGKYMRLSRDRERLGSARIGRKVRIKPDWVGIDSTLTGLIMGKMEGVVRISRDPRTRWDKQMR